MNAFDPANPVDPANTPAPARADWSLRLGTILQDEAELVILGLVLIAASLAASDLTPWSGAFGNSKFVSWITANLAWLFFACAAGAAILIPLTWLAWRNSLTASLKRLPHSATRQASFALALLGLLLLAAFYVFLWSRILPIPFQPPNLSDPNWGINVVDSQAAGALLALFTLLLLTRLCRRPLPFYLCVLAFFALALAGRYFFSIRPVLQHIMFYDDSAPHMVTQMMMNQHEIRPWMVISALLMPWGVLLQLLVPLLTVLYAIRRGFAWWKATAGWLLGWLFAYGALFLTPPPASRTAALMIVTSLVLVVLLLRFPRQRFALERLTGLALSGAASAPEPTGAGALTHLLGHAILVLLALGLAVFSVIGTAENRMARQSTTGVAVPHLSPALVNAYEIMKPWFDKDQGKPLNPHFSDEYNFLETMDVVPRSTLVEVKALIDPARLESEINSLQPALDLYVKAAAEADYCIFQEPGRFTSVNWANLRDVARAVRIRAFLRIMQDRPAEALADIVTNLRMAWLLNGDPIGNTVENLIAAAVRRLALASAQNYFNYYRQNPAALEQLRALLERDGRLVRFDYPSHVISRNDPGAWTVSPYFQISVLGANLPAIITAGSNFYQRWADYDVLQLATALEAFRRDQGRYPDRLEQLAPKYLARLPREPILGQPYLYANLGADFRLSYPVEGLPSQKQIDFSSAAQENSDARKRLDQLKAAKKSNAGSRPQ